MNYNDQVALVLETLPYLLKQNSFALKGGTAINLFILNMPRLSVDIDLTYIHLKQRDDALQEMQATLELLSKQLLEAHPGWEVYEKKSSKTKRIMKLIISNEKANIKIEPNEVLRGVVYPIQQRNLCQEARDTFKIEISDFPCLSEPDLYAGKLCAALDRQHPRDLFDVKQLFDNTGLTEDILNAFVVYLSCHSRPMNELLAPNKKSITSAYQGAFIGMTKQATSIEELLTIQDELPNRVINALSSKQKEFLLSMKRMFPDWTLLPFEHLENLPGIKWKLMNLKRMDASKHEMMLNRLEKIL